MKRVIENGCVKFFVKTHRLIVADEKLKIPNPCGCTIFFRQGNHVRRNVLPGYLKTTACIENTGPTTATTEIQQARWRLWQHHEQGTHVGQHAAAKRIRERLAHGMRRADLTDLRHVFDFTLLGQC